MGRVRADPAALIDEQARIDQILYASSMINHETKERVMNTTTEIRHFATTADKGAMGMLTEDIRVTDCGPYGASCSIGVIPEGSEARQVFQGPMVPGPWGYAFTHASVIDATGHAHRELMAQTTIELGDLFTVEGLPGVYCFRNPVVRWLEGEGPQLQHVPSVEDPRA